MHNTRLTLPSAFPTEFAEWPDGYSWSGTLSTEADGGGGSTCVVASTSSSVAFPSYPQPPVTMITRDDGIPDNEGLLFKPSYVIETIGMFLAAFTDVPAWVSCSPCPLPAPALEALTVRFVTDTSTSYEGSGNGAATPSPAAATPSSTQPKATSTTPASPSATKSSQPQATAGSKTPTPNSQSQSQAPSPAATSAANPAPSNSQPPESHSASAGSTQQGSGANSGAGGVSSQNSPATEVYTIVSQGSSGPQTLTITGTHVSVVVATVGQVYTTVVAGPSGSTTLTAVKPGSSITGSASVSLSTTEVVEADGTTRTLTVIAQPLASAGATTYTVIQTDTSGTSTMTVVGVTPEQTQPSAGLQNDAVSASGWRDVVLLGVALLVHFGCSLVL